MVQDTGGVLSLVQEENTSLSQLSSSPVSPPPPGAPPPPASHPPSLRSLIVYQRGVRET